MHRKRCLSFLVFLLATASALGAETTALTPQDLREVEQRIEKVLPNMAAATVAVRFPTGGSGSGVLVNETGLIITAGHVSGSPGRIGEVILSDGRRFRAKALGRNGVEDSGMMQIQFPDSEKPDKLPFVERGQSSLLKEGDWVLALGHPGGYRPDRGAVLRVGRIVRKNTFIVTDAVLVGGDSGGGLFSLDGKLIGIHSRIGTSNNDNRHVPIDKYAATWERLVSGEDWNPDSRREQWVRNQPWLGVGLEDDQFGARVTEVKEGPARAAGLLAGDVIMSFNEKEIANTESLATMVRSSKIGDSVRLELLRESGERVTIPVQLGRRPISR